ncbi:MAG: ABC transporter permease [Butyrivibrio sp.]|nr:ABC transporter permease [Butyrivibrio sp.]
MIGDIKDIWNFRGMIFELTHRELRGKYKGSLLGFLWTFVNPLCQIVVYAFFFSTIFRNGIEQFHVYLIIGMFPWNFFTGGVIQGLGSVRYQGDLIKKVYFPRQVLPIVSVNVNFVNMLLSFLIVYSAILVSGRNVDIRLQIYLIPIMIIEYIFTLGMALLLASIEVYFRDVEHITTVIIMVWMYVTPIFYDISFIPREYNRLFYSNPMLYIISSYHQVLYYKQPPLQGFLVKPFIISVVVLLIGWIVFDILERRFAEEL